MIAGNKLYIRKKGIFNRWQAAATTKLNVRMKMTLTEHIEWEFRINPPEIFVMEDSNWSDTLQKLAKAARMCSVSMEELTAAILSIRTKNWDYGYMWASEAAPRIKRIIKRIKNQ